MTEAEFSVVLEDAALGRTDSDKELDEGMAILLNVVFSVASELADHMSKAREAHKPAGPSLTDTDSTQ